MRRALLSLLIGAALLAGIPAQAFWQSRDSNYNIAVSTGASYSGPGDVVSGATAWYGLRAYNAAYAATPGKSVNLRRASDNVACDVNVAATGGLGLTTATCNSSTQGGITPTAFAGTDATATCTLASTTATCASASSTPHVGSTVGGASLTQPCLITAVGTFTGGAGTFTTSLAGTSTSCGAIGSGETFTMTYGLFVTEAYDQTGNGHHVTQATAGSQPQLLPLCANGGTLPCLYFNGTNSVLAGTIPAVASPTTISLVAQNNNGTSQRAALSTFNGGGTELGYRNSAANQAFVFGGSFLTATASDLAFHSITGIVNTGTTGVINVDGSATTGTTGTATTSTTISVGAITTNFFTGYQDDDGLWPAAFTTPQQSSIHSNASAFYGTP